MKDEEPFDLFLIVTREYSLYISPDEREWMEDDGVDIGDADAVFAWYDKSGDITDGELTQDYYLTRQPVK